MTGDSLPARVKMVNPQQIDMTGDNLPTSIEMVNLQPIHIMTGNNLPTKINSPPFPVVKPIYQNQITQPTNSQGAGLNNGNSRHQPANGHGRPGISYPPPLISN